MAIRSPQIRDLIQLYAMTTGQNDRHARHSAPSLVETGGSLFQSPQYNNGTPLPALGGLPTLDRIGGGVAYNINKTGAPGISFQPTYSSSTNQFTSIPGVSGALYDSVGNLLKDGAHTYTWDQNWGNVSGVDSATLTFDAFDRMVEQAAGSGFTQILYGPTGDKLALMNGTTLKTGFIPLIGGATAVYNASGLNYYRHSDWLGSSRLAVYASSRTVYFDGAYAPFGETYDYSGSIGNDFSFTGQNQDTPQPSNQSGLYDFLFREQSSVQGRWISRIRLARLR